MVQRRGRVTPQNSATSGLIKSKLETSDEVQPIIKSVDSSMHDEIEVGAGQLLKEVRIPSHVLHLPINTGSDSSSNSVLSSVFSNARYDSEECDTLRTTPARSVRGSSRIKRKRSDNEQISVYDHGDNEVEEDQDLALARQLQEEEYAETETGPSKRRRRVYVSDTDQSSESELSEPESDLSSVDSLPLLTRSKNTKTVTRTTRGSRGATRNIRKTIVEESDVDLSDLEAKRVEDSEDDFVVDGSDEQASLSEEEDEKSDHSREATTAPVTVTRRTKVKPASRVRRASQRNNRGSRSSRQSNAAYSGMGRKERERLKLENAHPQIKTMWADLEKIPIIATAAAAQPLSITRKLKSFQLEGLNWMMKQEKSHYRGGLLGDEMGMGKTIQAVSLIMSDYPQKQPSLVVVPPVALMQWSSEIKEYTDGKLNVLIYHGQNSKVKSMTVNQLKKFDVIMISYNSLESLHRKQTKGWIREDSIIKEDSPIHAIHFHRLILDEAHSIKSKTTGVAKACFALQGTYKWCLSGTPVQNRIGEFFSLLRFLEVRPFADYFCKRCPCSMLHWTFDEDHICTTCKHTSIEHVSVFNQELLNPLTQSEDAAERSAAMDKLHSITSRIMLRRVKRDHTSSMELPPKEVVVHNEFFGEIERDFSSSIMSNTTRQFDTYVARGVMLYVFVHPNTDGH